MPLHSLINGQKINYSEKLKDGLNTSIILEK